MCPECGEQPRRLRPSGTYSGSCFFPIDGKVHGHQVMRRDEGKLFVLHEIVYCLPNTYIYIHIQISLKTTTQLPNRMQILERGNPRTVPIDATSMRHALSQSGFSTAPDRYQR